MFTASLGPQQMANSGRKDRAHWPLAFVLTLESKPHGPSCTTQVLNWHKI